MAGPERPVLAVGWHKQRKLRSLAIAWLHDHDNPRDRAGVDNDDHHNSGVHPAAHHHDDHAAGDDLNNVDGRPAGRATGATR